MSDKWICNGKPDLLDGSDEQNCKQRSCGPEHQICDNNKCVPPEQVCDRNLNCLDGNDEFDCTECYNRCDGVCIAHSQVCDGHFDCKDKSDEENCEYWECSEGFWKCADGTCISERFVCDIFPDCADKSDENNCENWNCTEGYWKCADQKQCILREKVCDLKSTCQDASDEGEVGSCLDVRWNCSAGWLACTTFGLQCLAPMFVCDGNGFPEGCLVGNSDEENCEQWNCTDGYWKCKDNKQCIPFAEVCDGKDHCNDKSDETNCDHFGCSEMQWKCVNEKDCIETAQVCDGLSDCPNNSDEEGKRMKHGQFVGF